MNQTSADLSKGMDRPASAVDTAFKEHRAKNTYEKLSYPFPQDAVQATKKEETKKGYDTTGLGYQYVVNRFNDVLGLEGWGYSWLVLKELTGNYRSGAPYFEITVEVAIWVSIKDNARSCVGGHISTTHADALKGAITNGFKKAAAFWGVGRQAYEGTLDDDTFLPEQHEAQRTITPEEVAGELDGTILPPSTPAPQKQTPPPTGGNYSMKNPGDPMTPAQRRKLFVMLPKVGYIDERVQHEVCANILGKRYDGFSFNALTKGEASQIIDRLTKWEDEIAKEPSHHDDEVPF